MEGCEEALAGARRPPVALVVVEHLAQQRDGLLDGLGGGHGGAERRPRRGDDAGVEVDGPAAGRGGEERLARGPELADGLLERCVCRVRAPAGVLPRVRRDACSLLLARVFSCVGRVTLFAAPLVPSLLAAGGGACWPFSCLLYTSPSPRDRQKSRMPSSA